VTRRRPVHSIQLLYQSLLGKSLKNKREPFFRRQYWYSHHAIAQGTVITGEPLVHEICSGIIPNGCSITYAPVLSSPKESNMVLGKLIRFAQAVERIAISSAGIGRHSNATLAPLSNYRKELKALRYVGL
jgi:hypothetical protein